LGDSSLVTIATAFEAVLNILDISFERHGIQCLSEFNFQGKHPISPDNSALACLEELDDLSDVFGVP
jgi:hypothetical protein